MDKVEVLNHINDTTTFNGLYPSDHYPVVTEITIKKPPRLCASAVKKILTAETLSRRENLTIDICLGH